jgi:hypothetical protein
MTGPIFGGTSVDNHCKIFPALQQVVPAKTPSSVPTTVPGMALDQSFFAVGLPDKEGGVIWGYTKWCEFFAPRRRETNETRPDELGRYQ